MTESLLSKYKVHYEYQEDVHALRVRAAIKGWFTRRKNARKKRQS